MLAHRLCQDHETWRAAGCMHHGQPHNAMGVKPISHTTSLQHSRKSHDIVTIIRDQKTQQTPRTDQRSGLESLNGNIPVYHEKELTALLESRQGTEKLARERGGEVENARARVVLGSRPND